MSGPATASDVLSRAADVIERDGWRQGLAEDDDGRRCALGAIWHVSPDPDHPLTREAIARLTSCLPAVFHDWEQDGVADCEGIEAWNDRKSRTQRQVVEKLREAARGARTNDH